MKALYRSCSLALALALVAHSMADEKGEGGKALAPATNPALAPLQGTWSLVSGIADGMPIPEPMAKQMKRVCEGYQLTITVGGQLLYKAILTVDESQVPKSIDYQMIEGATKGKTQLGIYEFDGEKLRTCFSAPGSPRPADFTTKPGDHRTCTVWHRENSATQPADQGK